MKANPYAVQTVKCAVCDQQRKECNHWFVIYVDLLDDPEFSCWPLDLDDLPIDAKPVCGQACAQKLFEQWMLNQIVPD